MHDAELDRVAMDHSHRRLQLGFANADGSTTTVSFDGTLTWRMNNVQPQSVVSRCLVFGHGRNVGEDLDSLCRWTCSGAEGTLLIPEEVLRTHLGKIRTGNLTLFVIEPSCGAEIGVVAETLSIERSVRK